MIFPRKFSYQISHAAWKAVDLLFPPVCAGCGEMGERFCPECRAKRRRVSDKSCVLCGQSHEWGAAACPRVRWLDQAAAWGLHQDPLRKAVLALKYQGNLAMGDALCQLLNEVVAWTEIRVDLVVPVPLSVKREKERGYNQAALLARPLAHKMDMAYKPAALRRTRETDSQVGKTLPERRENVRGAFEAKPALVAGKRVLLVDDVLTTGSTLDAAAEALKNAGAVTVSAVVVSRAE